MIEYGITTSTAFIWLHVCPKDASIYWYERGLMVAQLGRFVTAEIASARGHLVRLFDNFFPRGIIHDCQLGYDFFDQWDWLHAQSDDMLGAYAEQCVFTAVKRRMLTLPVSIEPHCGIAEQFNGCDFLCRAKYSIEVKADLPGGVWGTGNLFVQTHEFHHQHELRNAHNDEHTQQSCLELLIDDPTNRPI